MKILNCKSLTRLITPMALCLVHAALAMGQQPAEAKKEMKPTPIPPASKDATPDSAATSDQYDPGADYKPLASLYSAVDDFSILSAMRCRYQDLLKSEPNWKELETEDVPKSIPAIKLKPDPSARHSLKGAITATVILYAEFPGGLHAIGGGVAVSKNGLVLTCEHVVKGTTEPYRMMAMTSTGKCFPVERVIAVQEREDLALIQLKGDSFKCVECLPGKLKMGSDLSMVHHGGSHYYTYDRGYLKRNGTNSLEVALPITPGSSGCGVFDAQWKLVGIATGENQIGDSTFVPNAAPLSQLFESLQFFPASK